MFTSDFNPFEILNKSEVQKNLKEVIDKVSKGLYQHWDSHSYRHDELSTPFDFLDKCFG